jgi:hypothetical protein
MRHTPSHWPRLRAANLGLAGIHLAQALLILALTNDFALPVTGSFLDGPPGSTPPQEELFEVPLGPAVAAFLLLAALDHLIVALPWTVGWYERNLEREINPARWIEYSFSASLMMTLIAMLTGITDVVALLSIFALTAAMIMFGWLMERFNDRRSDVSWMPFVFGSIIGVVPWLAVGISILGSAIESGGPPAFVYAIFVTLLVLYSSFAVNQGLQYADVGRWRSYLFGEWGYLVLSLVAKSALAWQVFANVLLD